MGTGVDSNVALPTRLACLTNLPLFTPRFYTVTRCPPSPGTQNTTSPSQPDPASLPSIGQDAPRAWTGQEGASLVPPRGWEIRTAMRLMLRTLRTGNWSLGWGVSACRPSARNHWLPQSQHEKGRFTREHTTSLLTSYCDVSPFFISIWGASEHLSLTWAQC